MHISLPTILFALGATAAVFNPVAVRDPVAALDSVAARDPVAVFDPVAAEVEILDRRGNNPFKKIRCGAVYLLHRFMCESVASYKNTCILIATVDYNYCKGRASIAADPDPAPGPNDKCPAACEGPGKACVAACEPLANSDLAKPCLEKCLAAATTCCGGD